MQARASDQGVTLKERQALSDNLRGRTEREPPAAHPLLDAMLSAPTTPAPRAVSAAVGQCSDERHPTLLGRVQVRWTGPGGEGHLAWLACLRGVVVRQGDRVLL